MLSPSPGSGLSLLLQIPSRFAIYLFLSFLFPLLLLACLVPLQTQAANRDRDRDSDADLTPIRGRVVKVHDGDTITILAAGKVQYKVRLEGIDAPEFGQPFGRTAKEVLGNAIFGRDVIVQPSGRDQYERLLGRVFFNGRDVNFDMITWGLAWHYARYSDDEHLAEAQQAARRARRGLWQEPDAVPPWQWRHSSPSQRR